MKLKNRTNLTDLIFMHRDEAERFVDWYEVKIASKGRVLLEEICDVCVIGLPDSQRELYKHLCFKKSLKDSSIKKISEGFQVILPKYLENI